MLMYLKAFPTTFITRAIVKILPKEFLIIPSFKSASKEMLPVLIVSSGEAKSM